MNLLLIATMLSAQGLTEPLPQKTEIPSDLSTVICPTEAAARTMLSEYYGIGIVRDRGISRFQKGLSATGCVENSRKAKSVITIRQILLRKSYRIVEGRIYYLIYRGTNAAGADVIGIVEDSEKNEHLRTFMGG
jgi:hypothetical protein